MFEENEISKNANGGTELISRHLQSILDPSLIEHFQIVPSRVREIAKDKIRIVFFNDLPNDPEVAKFAQQSYRSNFHHFVFISDWQREAYQNVLGFPYSDNCSTIEVGFEPIAVDWEKKKKCDKIKLVYTSTPQRGLSILMPVVDSLAQKHNDIHLDVFSSFKIYGWDEADKQFEPIYQAIRDHSHMTYRGFVPNEELRQHLSEAHIFAYPCVWAETSCRAMEEAMSAGLVCVHPNFAALPLTSGGLNIMYQGSSELNAEGFPEKHAQIFHANLDNAIEMVKAGSTDEYVKFVKAYADNRYNITKIKFQWERLLKGLLEKFPQAEREKSIPFTFDTSSLFK